MLKTLLCCNFLFIIAQIFSQNITISPYSAFGLGENKINQNPVLNSQGFTESTYISQSGSEINFINPAANRNLFFAAFNVSFTNELVNYKAVDVNENRSISYLSELSLAFPVGKKVKAGVGFQPFTATGYDINRLDTLSDPRTFNEFKGSGGLNTLQAFGSYSINDNVSLGLKANYLFGDLERSQQLGVNEAPLSSAYDTKNEIKGIQFTTGITYLKPLSDNRKWIVGATYALGNKIKSDNTYLESTFYYNSNNVRVNVDTIDYLKQNEKYTLPSAFSLGFSYEKNLKWRFALETKWNKASEFTFVNNNFSPKDQFRVSAGGWVIPNYNSYKSYFNRITYRYGAYYQNGSITINQEDIKQFGITFGFGLPVGKRGSLDPSMLNLGFELGKRGTQNNGLIEENFANFRIGINFNDIWFKERKYN